MEAIRQVLSVVAEPVLGDDVRGKAAVPRKDVASGGGDRPAEIDTGGLRLEIRGRARQPFRPDQIVERVRVGG